MRGSQPGHIELGTLANQVLLWLRREAWTCLGISGIDAAASNDGQTLGSLGGCFLLTLHGDKLTVR